MIGAGIWGASITGSIEERFGRAFWITSRARLSAAAF
jgi:hypothetical protein